MSLWYFVKWNKGGLHSSAGQEFVYLLLCVKYLNQKNIKKPSLLAMDSYGHINLGLTQGPRPTERCLKGRMDSDRHGQKQGCQSPGGL
jgi:hypothetical protein